ncbi:putative protein disulfide-isomerase [Zancudomyces culisetae]|uniref:Thioredoxin domain-containing protein n=1 Tax=Zancudomyces culisetae TaxID=1213189 RepID=A0A1R1PHG9_ZANCU|nr:putative protein disulfide-isomerase [Zancudomyces culisetae]|eukprot:OMH80421.1 putative protein disulfide-isomerase [Zancudomyces culisetae]
MRPTLALNLICLLLVNSIHFCIADSLYSRADVVELTPKNFDSLVHKSPYPVVVEFYAPWCGHCKSLAPIYKSAAKSGASHVKLYAVNCDDQNNRSLCSKYGIQGFPTLKGFFASNDNEEKIPIDYNGARESKAILDFARTYLKSKVKRFKIEKPQDVQEKIKKFLTLSNAPNALLFTDKSSIPNMWKGLSVGYGERYIFGAIFSHQESLVKEFSVTKYPTIMVIKNGDTIDKAIRYEDEMDYSSVVKFLKKYALPKQIKKEEL